MDIDVDKLVKKQVLRIKPYKPGKPIEEVKRELGLKSAIKLASNENPFGPSKRVIKALKKALPGIHRYPDGGSYYLKEALSKKFRLKPGNFVLGNGSDELIVLCLKAFACESDEVIITRPTFLIYEIASSMENAVIVNVPMRNFRYDLNAIADKLTDKTKIVFIANPDNPIGTYVTKEELDRFLSKIGQSTIVFMDEAYYEFARRNKDYPDTLPLIEKKNVIIARTFSKVYGMAGLRLGYAIGNRNLIGAMEKVREPFNVNSLAQAAGIAALKDDVYVKKVINQTDIGKRYLCESLRKLGYEFVPSATNFILINLKGDSQAVYNKLLKKGIIVREMGGWGLHGFIRVTIGTMGENKKFIKALAGIKNVK